MEKLEPIKTLSAQMGVDFSQIPLTGCIARLAENGTSLFRVNFDNAFICICFKPDAIEILNATVESILSDWEKDIFSTNKKSNGR